MVDEAPSDVRRRERNPIGALTRVLSAMVELDADSVGVRDLARHLDSPPSSLQRTLEAAQESGLVTSSPSGGWELGWEFFRLSTLAQRRRPFAAAGPVLERLRDVSGETAVLTVYDPGRRRRMFVDSAASHHSIRFVPELFSWLPMHAGATALAILAHRSETERQAVYDDGMPSLTPRTLVVPGDVERALAGVRDLGYSVSDDEVNLGAVAVAAPIRTLAGVTSSIGVILPRQRFEPIAREGLAVLVREAAGELEHRFGDPSESLRALVGGANRGERQDPRDELKRNA